jgi:hypothetical protein
VFLAEDVPDLVNRDRRCVELLLSTPWGREVDDRRLERRIAPIPNTTFEEDDYRRGRAVRTAPRADLAVAAALRAFDPG